MASAASREERQQMRLRGAGSRKVKDVNFGFSFGAAIPSQPAQPSPLRHASPVQQQPSPIKPVAPQAATPEKQSSLRRSPSLRRTPGSGGSAQKPRREAIFDIPPDNEHEIEQRSPKRRRISAFSRIHHEGPESSPTTRQMVTEVMSTLEPTGAQKAIQTAKAVEIPTSPSVPAQSPGQVSQTSQVPQAPGEPSRSEPFPIEIVPDTPVEEVTVAASAERSREQEQAGPSPDASRSKPPRRKKRKSVVLLPKKKKKRQSSPLQRVENVASSAGHDEAEPSVAVEIPPATDITTTTKAKQSRKKRPSIVKGPPKRRWKKKDATPQRQDEHAGIEKNAEAPAQSMEGKSQSEAVSERGAEEEQGEEVQEQRKEGRESPPSSPVVHERSESEHDLASEARSKQQPKRPISRKRRRRKKSEEEQPLQEEEAHEGEKTQEPEPEPQPEGEGDEGASSPKPARQRKEKKQRTPRSTVPVTVHRLANVSALEIIPEEDEGTPRESPDSNESVAKTTSHTTPALPVRSGVSATDVLSQICKETLEKTLSTLESAIERESNRARRTEWARKRKAVEAFGTELENRLFQISELSDGNYGLAMRLRKEKKEHAALRNRLMDIRKQREEVGVRIDEVRRKFNEDESVRQEQGNVNNALHDLQLAVDRSQKTSSKSHDESGEDNPFAGLEFLLRSVARDVSSTAPGSEGGLLQQVKAFNARLEAVAEAL